MGSVLKRADPIYINKKMIKWPKQWIEFVAIALIIIAGFIAYSNSLKSDFVWDDELLVKDNIYIRDWSKIAGVFSGDFGSGDSTKGHLYRPLQMITYAADYSLWGLNPRGYHITNMLLHILAAIALFWFVKLVFDDRLLSFLTSILFVVYPLHTEAVAYISGRADSLVTLFMLLCLIFYIKQITFKAKGIYFLILLSYILALFSKEYGLIVPMLVIIYSYAFKKKILAREFLSLLAISLIYLILRIAFIPSHAVSTSTFFQRIPGFFIAITEYLKLLLAPFNLHMEYGNKLFTFYDARALSGAAISLLLLAYAFFKRNNNRLLFFSILWFFVSLLPVSNLYPVNAYMAEHWIYVPSIGFFIIVSRVLSYSLAKERLKVIALAVTVCMICGYLYLTIQQNKYWKNNVSFEKWTARYVSDSSRFYALICKTCIEIGNAEKGEPLCRKAIELDPENASAYSLLGFIYAVKGLHNESIACFKRAININPAYIPPYINLGSAYAQLGNFSEAKKVWENALKINPQSVEIRENLYRLEHRKETEGGGK